MTYSEDKLNNIESLLSNGLDNSSILIASAGDVLTIDDLDRSFAIYAPFGDVDITSLTLDYAGDLGTQTIIGGSQIFGRLTTLTIAAGSNPLLIYKKK